MLRVFEPQYCVLRNVSARSRGDVSIWERVVVYPDCH